MSLGRSGEPRGVKSRWVTNFSGSGDTIRDLVCLRTRSQQLWLLLVNIETTSNFIRLINILRPERRMGGIARRRRRAQKCQHHYGSSYVTYLTFDPLPGFGE
jgi:hypothetical protein